MKTTTRMRLICALLAVSALAAAAGATTPGRAAIATLSRAASRPNVLIHLQATVDRDVQGVTYRVPAAEAGTVRSGEKIYWAVTWENKGDAPAHGFKATNRITPGTQLVPGSVHLPEGTAVTYSTDGGKTFSATPKVPARQPDGTVDYAPAPVSAYDHIRFEAAAPVAPGARAQAIYEVRVR